ERHGEKEPQRGDGGVDRSGAGLLLRHMQLIATKILARRRIRRPAEEGCELPHIANVVPLRVFAETARRHVVDQALTQRADGLLGHGKLLSRVGLNPTILRQGRAFPLSLLPRSLRSLAALPRERFSPWTESGPSLATPVGSVSAQRRRRSRCRLNNRKGGERTLLVRDAEGRFTMSVAQSKRFVSRKRTETAGSDHIGQGLTSAQPPPTKQLQGRAPRRTFPAVRRQRYGRRAYRRSAGQG